MKLGRLTNSDLEYFEDTIGASLGIITRTRQLAVLIDDPETLLIVLGILERAQTIRKSTIALMNQKKDEVRNVI